MTYEPPFLPKDRSHDESLRSRVARARTLREEAAARVAKRYAAFTPKKGEWRTGESHDLEMERPRVL